MRTTFPLRIFRNAILSLLLLAAACDKATAPRYGEEEEHPSETEHSIVHLKSLCGRADTPVTEDLIIRGRVVGNDRFGEFARRLVIEDRSGGITIALERGGLADDYPFGMEIIVRCNGLTLCNYGGKVMLGAGTGEYGVEGVAEERIPLHIRPGRQHDSAPRPVVRKLPDLGMPEVDTYVRIEGVRFTAAGTWCVTDPATQRSVTTEHTLVDADGNAFTLRVPSTCSYAKEPVPSGTGSMGCIPDYFDGRLSLRVTCYDAQFATAAAPPTAYP